LKLRRAQAGEEVARGIQAEPDAQRLEAGEDRGWIAQGR
jgi:hypothetical protein